MKNLAIIPARGGSKRIPQKNIKDFLGKPIIAYSIELALDSGLFDEVMVSTDDKEIAKVAQKFGAIIPFMRSASNSDDYATTEDVLLEVINEYKKRGSLFRFGCCIYPTAPLLRSKKVQYAFDLMTSNDYDAVFPIMKFGYPIWRSLKLTDGKVQLNWPEYKNSRSQDLPQAYHDSGQFYWFNVERFLQSNTIFTENCGGIEISEMEAQDIDNDADWKMAEIKYSLLHA